MFASVDTVPDIRFPQPRPYPVLAKPCTGPEQFVWSVHVAEVSRARERERERVEQSEASPYITETRSGLSHYANNQLSAIPTR